MGRLLWTALSLFCDLKRVRLLRFQALLNSRVKTPFTGLGRLAAVVLRLCSAKPGLRAPSRAQF